MIRSRLAFAVSAAALLAAPSELSDELNGLMSELIDQFRLKEYGAALDELDKLCVAYILAAFQEMGWTFRRNIQTPRGCRCVRAIRRSKWNSIWCGDVALRSPGCSGAAAIRCRSYYSLAATARRYPHSIGARRRRRL